MDKSKWPKPTRSVPAAETAEWRAYLSRIAQEYEEIEKARNPADPHAEHLNKIRLLILGGQDKEAYEQAQAILQGPDFDKASHINKAGTLYLVGCFRRKHSR